MAWDAEPKELLEELLKAVLQNLGASEKHSFSILLPNKCIPLRTGKP